MSVHTATVKHDLESHDFDCHDDCTVSLSCSGVSDACRCWWECDACREALGQMDDDAREEYDERLWETSEAHGVEHQHIDGMWMTPTDRCLTSECDWDSFDLLVLPDGDHAVDIECEEGFLRVWAVAS